MLYHLIKIIIIILFINHKIYENKYRSFQYKFKSDKRYPKISIFLPIYNKEKYINSSIKSIQCQTLKDIEIIAVNDFSNDKSLEILKRLSSTDKRIKILNNNKNNGLLYSRTIGILNSNGEYLMNLDPDDNLKNENSLEIIYNNAKKNNVDIISFGAFYKNINQMVFNQLNVQILGKSFFSLKYLIQLSI